jgi:hypothetical protein
MIVEAPASIPYLNRKSHGFTSADTYDHLHGLKLGIVVPTGTPAAIRKPQAH